MMKDNPIQTPKRTPRPRAKSIKDKGCVKQLFANNNSEQDEDDIENEESP
jgi:hypothetical protein